MVVLKRVYNVVFFERPLEKFDNRFGLSKQHKKHWAPRQRYKQEASIESVSFRWLIGGARGPIRRNRSNRRKTNPAQEYHFQPLFTECQILCVENKQKTITE